MFKSDFICTYTMHETEDQLIVYQAQLLQAFDLEIYDEKTMETRISELYQKVYENCDMQTVFSALKQSQNFKSFMLIIGNNNRDIFTLLFSFDLFDISHKCLGEIITKGKISGDNMEKLLSKIESV